MSLLKIATTKAEKRQREKEKESIRALSKRSRFRAKIVDFVLSLDPDLRVSEPLAGITFITMYNIQVMSFTEDMEIFDNLHNETIKLNKLFWRYQLKRILNKRLTEIVSNFRNSGINFADLKKLEFNGETPMPDCKGCFFFKANECDFVIDKSCRSNCKYHWKEPMKEKQSEIVKKLATEFHSGQFRKDGLTPYIVHPKAVAEFLEACDAHDDVIAAAWGHDILEDCGDKIAELKKSGCQYKGDSRYSVSDERG